MSRNPQIEEEKDDAFDMFDDLVDEEEEPIREEGSKDEDPLSQGRALDSRELYFCWLG